MKEPVFERTTEMEECPECEQKGRWFCEECQCCEECCTCVEIDECEECGKERYVCSECGCCEDCCTCEDELEPSDESGGTRVAGNERGDPADPLSEGIQLRRGRVPRAE